MTLTKREATMRRRKRLRAQWVAGVRTQSRKYVHASGRPAQAWKALSVCSTGRILTRM